MCNDPEWLPPLILLSDYDGNPAEYLDAVYERFCADLVFSKAQFKKLPVSVRRTPESKGKGYGFWHCISEGEREEDRIPDLERCKRIGWIRAIIENITDSNIDCWPNHRNGRKHWLLWFREEYLVVLAEHDRYYLLKTGYCTSKPWKIKRLQAERDEYYRQEKPTPP